MKTYCIIFPLSSDQINGAKESISEIIEDFGKRNVKTNDGNSDDSISFALEFNKELSVVEREDIQKIADRHDAMVIFINTEKTTFPSHFVFNLELTALESIKFILKRLGRNSLYRESMNRKS